ncbi:DUF1028 domain-containing protein [Alkalicoccus daliensis]|uniref:Uncharacterized conserved protein, Ntn-hydrolase superfamily n=1 Tax=Alkalicoccus daliensis TaxID=745820 RepID=A0A1H0I7B7_9BACI|nr:DUF1028 domain-containing protein [Alkalicoccus daliensis]SDO27255.1 Uncharacterized conserved protein, Ntn-hydrolase superfamily [Alkalicoccus daliensis]
MKKMQPKVATYSLIGFDPETNETGIVVQSKFLGVGAVVPWAKAGVGAVATQSFANTSFGPQGLDMLEKGMHPEEVKNHLIAEDHEKELRQFAIMNANGETAVFTGTECYDWAGDRMGKFCSAQGNILLNKETVDALVETFENSSGPLAERLLSALEEAEKAGGDARGKQSAALFIVQEKGGYGGYNDRKYDLRVDDHKEPIKELKRLYELHQLYFSKPEPGDLLVIEKEVLKEIEVNLISEGLLDQHYNAYNVDVKEALKNYFLRENFEERWQEEDKIDPAVLTYMRAGQ